MCPFASGRKEAYGQVRSGPLSRTDPVTKDPGATAIARGLVPQEEGSQVSKLTVVPQSSAGNTSAATIGRTLRDRRADSVAPDRSLHQRRAALARANEIRVYRAELKRNIHAHRGRTVMQILLAPRPEEETWKASDLVVQIPKVGKVRTNKILQTARISPSKTIGGMTARQRAELILLLGQRAA
jgi:hypothetical protein